LRPWMRRPSIAPEVLILDASILQSRHAFDAALAELDRALTARPNDPQAWLTRATILRVLGRYEEALSSCQRLASEADPAITTLCLEGVRALTGHLRQAYSALTSMNTLALAPQARTWRFSELGEMAERLGQDEAAEQWFQAGLGTSPQDLYMRAAYADLLLRHQRATEVLTLLAGYDSMEPMLLRAAVAHRELQDNEGKDSNALLSMAFEVEQQRGDAVHRRELARYLLDIERQPDSALSAAQQNWRVQREPDDLLILLRAAHESHRPEAAAGALAFLRETRLEDARLDPYRGGL